MGTLIADVDYRPEVYSRFGVNPALQEGREVREKKHSINAGNANRAATLRCALWGPGAPQAPKSGPDRPFRQQSGVAAHPRPTDRGLAGPRAGFDSHAGVPVCRIPAPWCPSALRGGRLLWLCRCAHGAGLRSSLSLSRRSSCCRRALAASGSTRGAGPRPTHAALALGGASVAVRPSEIEGAGLGAFALREWAAAEWIAACDRALLGPRRRAPQSPYSWGLSTRRRLRNPMRYVSSIRLAESCGSHNVVVRPVPGNASVQYYAHTAIEKLVEKGAELLVDRYSSVAGGSPRTSATLSTCRRSTSPPRAETRRECRRCCGPRRRRAATPVRARSSSWRRKEGTQTWCSSSSSCCCSAAAAAAAAGGAGRAGRGGGRGGPGGEGGCRRWRHTAAAPGTATQTLCGC